MTGLTPNNKILFFKFIYMYVWMYGCMDVKSHELKGNY